MLLDKEQFESLRNSPKTDCDDCGAKLRSNYCRRCDDFFHFGHHVDCDMDFESIHLGHRTYREALYGGLLPGTEECILREARDKQLDGNGVIIFELNAEGGGHYYFVASSEESMMADTEGGTEFAGIMLTSYRKISILEARELGLKYIDDGIEVVTRGRPCTFLLGAPQYL